MGWGGRYLVIGFAGGDIPRIALNLPLLKGTSIVGVFWGMWMMREPKAFAANRDQLITWTAEGKLKPHIHRLYGLSQGVEALLDMESRKVVGKAVVVTPTYTAQVAQQSKL
eukprot:c11447_g1_i2.p2 GENE.c11447_g1_i2~~c11447_g1_i2.p2  ORF type:complete len:111 (-),score=28.96 c11447_g1_i2:118-450(-)